MKDKLLRYVMLFLILSEVISLYVVLFTITRQQNRNLKKKKKKLIIK